MGYETYITVYFEIGDFSLQISKDELEKEVYGWSFFNIQCDSHALYNFFFISWNLHFYL